MFIAGRVRVMVARHPWMYWLAVATLATSSRPASRTRWPASTRPGGRGAPARGVDDDRRDRARASRSPRNTRRAGRGGAGRCRRRRVPSPRSPSQHIAAGEIVTKADVDPRRTRRLDSRRFGGVRRPGVGRPLLRRRPRRRVHDRSPDLRRRGRRCQRLRCAWWPIAADCRSAWPPPSRPMPSRSRSTSLP